MIGSSGTWIFHIGGRGPTWGDADPGIDGSMCGVAETLTLTGHFSGRLNLGAASATPSAALSGQNPKAPGFAGGYLLVVGYCELIIRAPNFLRRPITRISFGAPTIFGQSENGSGNRTQRPRWSFRRSGSFLEI